MINEFIINSIEINEELKKLVEGKRVCICGPSITNIDTNLGNLIDSYDIVCRINFRFPFNNCKDYGKKSDIIFSGPHRLSIKETRDLLLDYKNNKYKEFINNTKLIYIVSQVNDQKHKKADITYQEGYDNFKEFCNENEIKYGITNIDIQKYIKKYLIKYLFLDKSIENSTSNSGIHSILVLLKHNPIELFITGFNFFNFGKGNISRNLYLNENIDEYKKENPNSINYGHIKEPVLNFFKELLFEFPIIKLDRVLQEYFFKFMKISICTVCDIEYLNYFENFIHSFILNEKNPNVFLNHFFIYKNKKEIESIKNIKYINHKNIIVHLIYLKNKYCNEKNFILHYRFDAVKKLLQNKNYSKIIYLDIDSLINKSIYEKVSELNYSFNLYPRYNILNEDIYDIVNTKLNNFQLKQIVNYEKKKFENMGFIMAGIFIIKNNSEGLNIIKKLIHWRNISYFNYKIKKKKYIDQLILSNIFLKYEVNLLSTKLFDFNFNQDSYIYMAKGKDYPTNSDGWLSIIKKNKNDLNMITFSNLNIL